ncbi:MULTISPECIES: threonine aldolase family protein [unclassified Moraxella]|uniref:threonine aldolase family protein n=1 Tax=unclassified Moraxella TaxID=2685852 RepID=UPI003AF441C4
MYSFMNDYSEGAYPAILQALMDSNLEQQAGYGLDKYSQQVADIMREKTQNPHAQTFLVTGGTQANLLCLANLLRPVEAVMCADTGHIYVNEAGAIEATGHKVVAVPSEQGKVTVAGLTAMLAKFQLLPHVVRIKAVYISNTTEVGTVYSLSELQAISAFCREHGLYLMMDGARLGSALASVDNDISLTDLGRLVDVFWFGGTKMGALFGEAIVINQPKLAEDFGIYLKQHGALLAKGRALGVQFVTLFKDDAYLNLCRHANNMAKQLADGLLAHGCELAYPLQSNQLFVKMPNRLIAKLKQAFAFYEWQKLDDNHSLVRLVTSWATDEKQVARFCEMLSQ